MFFSGLLGGGDGTVSGGNATMEFIASQFSRSMGAPVLDRTELTGPFDFTLKEVYDPEERDVWLGHVLAAPWRCVSQSHCFSATIGNIGNQHRYPLNGVRRSPGVP
jgi:hypothetical protein